MKFSARQIAEFLHGELVGNPSVEVNNLSKIEEGTPGTLSFLANPKYTHYIYQTHASIVLVHKDFEPEHPIEATLIKVDDPYACLALLLNLVNEAAIAKRGIEQPNYVSSSVTLPDDIYLGAFAYIGERVKIGALPLSPRAAQSSPRFKRAMVSPLSAAAFHSLRACAALFGTPRP